MPLQNLLITLLSRLRLAHRLEDDTTIERAGHQDGIHLLPDDSIRLSNDGTNLHQGAFERLQRRIEVPLLELEHSDIVEQLS